MGLFSKQTVHLDIAGMTCGNCVQNVTKALQDVDGVKKIQVDVEGEAVVTVKPGTNPDALVAAIRVAGYAASVTKN